MDCKKYYLFVKATDALCSCMLNQQLLLLKGCQGCCLCYLLFYEPKTEHELTTNDNTTVFICRY